LKKIIDKIASWLVALNERKAKADDDYATFMKRGNNGLVFGVIFCGLYFLYLSYDFYETQGELWYALIPLLVYVISVFVILVLNSYKVQMKKRHKSTSLKLVGFNMDFNERILRKIYLQLIRYEFLDEDRNQFEHFYNVLVYDFDDHESVLHFNCTQAELKYILEKFKPFKKGLHLSTFERSEKIFNKNRLISAESLSKNYNKHPLTTETEDLIDSIFDFLGDN